MKKTCRVMLAIVLTLAFLPTQFAQTRGSKVKRRGRIPATQRLPQPPFPLPTPIRFPPPVTHIVTVNPNGSFTPPILTIRPGDTVSWHGLSRTDAIVQIANPLLAPRADVCGINDDTLDHPFNGFDANEFTGPMRKGVSGIFVLGPNGPGFGEVPAGKLCDCERQFPPCTLSLTRAGGNKLCPEEGGSYDLLPETWTNPDITGVVLRFNWRDLQKDIDGQIKYVWSDLDRQMNLAVAHGKLFTLDVRAGSDGTPAWIFANYPGAAGPGPVTPLYFKDWPDGSTPPAKNCGYKMVLGSPTHVNYRNLYLAMIEALARHVASDSRWFQALAHVKVSGANYITSEARLPRRCHDSNTDADDKLDTVGNDDCICNSQRWADASYTPAGLFQYYRAVENKIYEAFFRQKSLGYQLIQDGFPRVESTTNFLGDSLRDQSGNHLLVPSGQTSDDLDSTMQTVTVLQEGRDGRFVDPFGAAPNSSAGHLFVAQHSGLRPLPNDSHLILRCVQQQLVDPNMRARFPNVMLAAQIPDDGIPGCPNPWAVREGFNPNLQIMGFQTTNGEMGVDSPAAVESALWNLTMNSNGVFVELYEQRLWEISQRFGTGRLAHVLDDRRFGWTSNPAPYSKNLFAWGEELHDRRRELVVNDPDPNRADPFPTVYEHTFSPFINAQTFGTYFYINPSKCSTAPPLRRVGSITIAPPLLVP